MFSLKSSSIPCGLVASALLFATPAFGQNAEDLFHEAYYLEHEEGDLGRALKLYRKVAQSERTPAEMRSNAKERSAGIAEELAAGDFARLMPPETIFFAELDRPGAQVGLLLKQLGLLGEVQRATGEQIAVSPLLVNAALGLRGAAVAVTEIGMDGQPAGVVLLHPGSHEGLRGLIETFLPAGGVPAGDVDGFPVWTIEGEAYVCLTRRLVIAGSSPRQIAGVVKRLSGSNMSSLADEPGFAEVIGTQQPGLLNFYVNAEPVKPMLRAVMEQEARNDPGARMAMNLLDIDSLQSFSGRLAVERDGLALDLALQLDEGHRNVVFNLLRRPTVKRDTLKLVPEGAAFFLATAFNPEGQVAPLLRDEADQPVVTVLDFGRELFGNIVDIALYGMPPSANSPRGLPDVTLVLRVNDVDRSIALMELALGMASQGSGGDVEFEQSSAGFDVTRYSIEQMPIFLASGDQRVVISSNRDSMERALGASRGQSVLADLVFADGLKVLKESPTLLIAACPGRMATMASPFMSPDERAELRPVVDLLGETSLTIAAKHSSTKFGLGARVHHIPDVSPLIAEVIAEARGGRGEVAVRQPAAVRSIEAGSEGKAFLAGNLKSMSRDFNALADAGDHTAANRLGGQIAATVDDAKGLNNLAWALLTEDRYEGAYNEVARVLSRRANELSEYSSWYFLDTGALAEFRTGNFKEAVELQVKVLRLADDNGAGDHTELLESLERYRAALAQEAESVVSADTGR